METNQTHNKIIAILEQKGPCLPIHLAKELNMSSLFISAFLSELTSEKKIKVSHLKVGGSPLYFLEGQEQKLEPYHKYLHPREIEAFQLLKKKKILKDSEQEPAIRVALRSIRDFSIGFKKNDEIYWRYMLIPESEIDKLIKPKKAKRKTILREDTSKKPLGVLDTEKEAPIITITKKDKIKEEQFQNPLIIKEAKKQKPKSEFVQKTINILNKNFIIIDEKDYKPKEYNCIIQIKSELGPINFLTQAKDKKTISETDVKKLLSNAQKIPLPAFMIYTGELSKKAKEYLIKYSSILKAKRIS